MSPNPVLVTSTRSDLVEIQHRGAFCVVGADGRVWIERGDCGALTYPRSSLKFIQVLPLLETAAVSDFGISDDEIALMCASHSSEPRHVAAARSILAKAGLDERHLRCGTHTPLDETAFAQIIRAGETVAPIHNNCSGKHAGFLALAKHLGADVDRYLELDHPVQARIRQAVCDVYDMTEAELYIGVDGCTAPNYGMSVLRMARGFARLCCPDISWSDIRRSAITHMQRAVLAHPFMVAGTDRFCTDMMLAMEGAVLGKLGAAGVYVFGLPGQGIGGAVKIDDGATGPQYTVVTALLSALGVGPAAAGQRLERFARSTVRNCRGEVVGYGRFVEDLLAPLQDALAD
jgi:L-asparaginase II